MFEAIDEYKAAIRLNSRLANAYRALAWASIARHKYSEAQEYFDNFRKAAPNDHSIWEDIGQMWSQQNQSARALKAFQKALKYNPESAVALLGLGNIESRNGNDAKALKLYARAAKADVYNGAAMCQYAIALANTTKNASNTITENLKRCLALEQAPEDMRMTAQELLENNGSR